MQHIDRGQAGYPAGLEELVDPPRSVWVRGALPGGTAVAIVGARGADLAGRRFAYELARTLGEQGLVVISGGARGIDRAAHEGALAAGARTVAVLGSGADVAYPPEHEALYASIERGGALVSELPPGTTPRRGTFPRRNRIIAALARACVVVQADERSGSLVTARHARALARPVLAVPWGPGAALGRGTAELLRRGARVATGANDVLHALDMPASTLTSPDPGTPVPRTPLGRTLLSALGASGSTVDELVFATSAKLHDVSATLLTLELDGLVVRSDCGRYERT